MTSSKIKLSCNLLLLLFFFCSLFVLFLLFTNNSILFFFVFLFFWLAFLPFYFFHTLWFHQLNSCVIMELINIFDFLFKTWFRLIWSWLIFNDTKTFLSIWFYFFSISSKLLIFKTLPKLTVEVNYWIHLWMNYRVETAKVFKVCLLNWLTKIILMFLRRLFPQKGLDNSISWVFNRIQIIPTL